MSRFVQLPYIVGSSQYDENALAFIALANVTDDFAKKGINAFVKNLKSNALWDLLYAIYPFTGHADGYKYNLKNISKHAIDFSSPVEFLSDGIRFNTGTGNLNFSAADMTTQDISAHLYIKENTNALTQDIGQVNTIDSNKFGMHTNYKSITYFDLGYTSTGRLSISTDTVGGLISGNRSGGVQGIYKNGILKASKTNTLNISLVSLVLNATVENESNPRIFPFFALGKGFTDAQMALFYTEIQQLMTVLGRNV